MSGVLFRAFGAVQDSITRVAYGKETKTTKMAFYECVDRLMDASEVKVRRIFH